MACCPNVAWWYLRHLAAVALWVLMHINEIVVWWYPNTDCISKHLDYMFYNVFSLFVLYKNGNNVNIGIRGFTVWKENKNTQWKMLPPGGNRTWASNSLWFQGQLYNFCTSTQNTFWSLVRHLLHQNILNIIDFMAINKICIWTVPEYCSTNVYTSSYIRHRTVQCEVTQSVNESTLASRRSSRAVGPTNRVAHSFGSDKLYIGLSNKCFNYIQCICCVTDVRPSQDHRILRMQTVRINLAYCVVCPNL